VIRGGRKLGVFGPARLEKDFLMEEAVQATGLDDFGDGWFERPLEVLLDSVKREAQLNAAGEFSAMKMFHHVLRDRLYTQMWFKRHPEILARPLKNPVVIVGPMRSGTTRLHRLLAADQRFAHLRSFETISPVPRPEFEQVLAGEAEDFRVPLEPHLRVEPGAQHVVKHLRGGKFACRVELRFVLHAVEQHLEGLFEPAVAEIVEPRGRCRFFQQGILVEMRRAEHPQLASAPDHPVRNIDKARAARRLDRLVVQAGWPFKLADVPLNVRGLMRCPQKDKLAPLEVAGQAGSETA
jgi:hypothetical protein